MAFIQGKRDTRFPGSDLFNISKELALPRDGKVETTKVLEVPKPNYSKLNLREVPRLNTFAKLNTPARSNTPATLPPPEAFPHINEASPLVYYEKAYGIELGGSVIRVCLVPETEDMFTMRSLSGPDAKQKLNLLRRLKHVNILTPLVLFSHDNEYSIISEDAEVSLEELIIARPNEIQLAAIITQVLDLLVYFQSKGLVHGGITRSNILLTKKGVGKVANPENCIDMDLKNSRTDVRALGEVMEQLMENKAGYPTNWSVEAVDFLTLTKTKSAEQLSTHQFLKKSRIATLVRLVSLAQVSARRFWNV